MSVFRNDLHKGKVAFVTGGATGINFGITKALGEHGAKVFIMSRRESVLQEACKKFSDAGIECGYAVGDVRDNDACIAAIEKCATEMVELIFW